LWQNGGDPGQPDQHLPPPRRGPATLFHAVVDESIAGCKRKLPNWLPDQWKLQLAARLRILQNPATPTS